MISTVIKKKIESQFGQPIRYSKDCDALAAEISRVTNHMLSGSTLKRLMGFVKGINNPRMYTMDVISEYLGYDSFDDLIQEFNTNPSSEQNIINELTVDDISVEDTIKFEYDPDIKITLKYINHSTFEVLESLNPNLQVNDIIQFEHIVKSYPLFIKDVVRNKKHLGKYIAGKVSGITSIKVIK